MLDVIGRLTTRHAWWVLAFWTAVLAAALVARPGTLPGVSGVPGGYGGYGGYGEYGPLPPDASGAFGAGVALLALLAFLRSPAATLTAVLAALAVHSLSAVAIAALGLPAPPGLFAYGTTTACATMLIHRFRERLASGDGPVHAVRTSLDQAGRVIATAGAAWIASCGALPLGAYPPGFGPALALTASVQLLVVLTLLPAVLAVLGSRLAWPSRRRRTGRPAARFGLAVAAHPGTWTALAAGLIVAMGAIGPVLVPSPLPVPVMAVAGVLVALVLALVLRSLISPVYLTAGALLVAWASGTAAAPSGDQIAVFMFVLVVSVTTALLVLARVRETARTGRDPRTCSALATKYAAPPALAALLAAGTLTATVYDVLSGVCLVAGGAALSLVVVPGLTAMLGARAWWPDAAPAPSVRRTDAHLA
ncbi:MMPL family transporter [Sphaerisporangium sp. NPDC049002]|uniref:MMPL family transporter n=1 Tax=unclassified Sphaerisporangium TaxID=2630420 RepID=UPI0033D09524